MRDLPLHSARHRPVLRVEDLKKSFRGAVALDGVSFTVPESSLTAILGPVGAGKTTTLRLIAGLDRPDAGRVVIAGEDVNGWEPKDRNIAMILDTLALYPNKTGFENMASPLRIRGVPRGIIDEKVGEVARTLRVLHLLNRLPKTMSGGERQRVALGRALVRTPSLFLLDEPLSSLDAMLRIELRAELKRLQRELGHTFLLATPDFQEAMAVADTVILLREGRVVQSAGPQEVYDKPFDCDIALFVGSPQINLLEARYVSDADAGYIEAAGGRIEAPLPMRSAFKSGSGEFVLGIRPENFRVVDPFEADIRGVLADIEPMGLKSVLTVRNDAAELRLTIQSGKTQGLSIHQNLGLRVIDPAKMLAFDSVNAQLLNSQPAVSMGRPRLHEKRQAERL